MRLSMEEKKNYGATLNLPKTDFPMRGNLPENEPKIKEEVLDNDLYEKMLKKNEGKESFVLHDGPPYANGEIHLGHALNKILKDTIVRFKNLEGYYTPYVPGFDTHGLPTERKAIEVLGLDRDKVGVNKFRNTCKDFALGFVEKQSEGFKRLGVLGDWKDPYITLRPEFESRQIGVFGDMYKKGYIYKGLKPVFWCTECETALAEAEIEYKDSKATSIFVKFPVVEGNGVITNDTSIVIWTTTPWTLPGNMGITVDSEFIYAVVEANNEKLVMAKELVDQVMKKAGIEEYKIIKTFKGSQLEGVLCKHPFLDRTSKVVLGSEDTVKVDLEMGTGAVHTAPGYGKEDYLCGLKNGLDIVVTVDAKGHQTEGAGPFAGMYYAKSNTEIIKWLDENGYLLQQEELMHSYPHCWRCKKPIIYRATDQWFASVDGFRKETLEQVKKVKWFPSWGEERISEMIRDRNDWCISRQRTWGVPIPIFYCKDCGKEYVTEESIKKVQEIFREKGSNAWFDEDEKELMPEGATCPHCGCKEFKKETDIMDVWFDSGSSHQGVLVERGIAYPADLYLEGQDQYRGWFQSSMLTSVAVNGVAPYKQVLTHGFIVDDQGRKMSKSLGNGIAPQDIVKEYGADALRLYEMFMGPIDAAKPWDITGIEGTKKFLDRIWRLYVESGKISNNHNSNLDKIYNYTVKKVTNDYENMYFNTAISQMMIFINAVYKEETLPIEYAEGFLKLLNPVAPHITEELWNRLNHNKTIAYEKWPEYDESKITENEIEIPVQINGKVKETITIPVDLEEGKVKEIVHENGNIANLTNGKTIVKEIYVKNKIYNIVIK